MRFLYKLFNIKYSLTGIEKEIWKSIKIKADAGYREWLYKTKCDDMCGAWIKDISSQEIQLIDKIYNKFYGEFYCASPISNAQCSYIQYEKIKNKVI